MLVDILLRQRSGMAPVRMLITTPTYRALMEIVTRVAEVWTQIPNQLRHELADSNRWSVTFLLGHGRAKAFEPLLTDGRYCGVPPAMLDDRQEYASVRERLSTRSGAPIELIFAVARQAYTLGKGGGTAEDPEPNPVIGLFDRIWIDESSQLAVAQALPVLSLLDEDGAIGCFGDRLQMPPVQIVPPPRHAEYLVGSIHTYLYERIRRYEAHNGGAMSYTEQFLRMNYRSCEPIVAFSRQIGYRDEFTAVDPYRRLAHVPLTTGASGWDTAIVPWTPIYEAILVPDRPCVAVTYDDGRNGQANTFEAALVAGTILTHRASCLQQVTAKGGGFNEKAFWTDVIGVVTPHRAQRAAVVSLLQRALTSEGVPADLIEDAVDTVERFQGGERDLILISFGLGDPDLIQHEEEFLFQKERINVAVTRAKAKVVVFVTRDLSYHLPDDPVIIEASKAIKNFVYQHARHEDLPVAVTAADRELAVRVRFRTFAG
jgi:AAA domain